MRATGSTPERSVIGDPMLTPRPFRILAKTVETHDVTTLHVVPADGGPLLRHEPAQVAMVGAFGFGEAAISYSSAVQDRTKHSFTIRATGPITKALTAAAIGDWVTVRGPFGRPWPVRDLHEGTVVVIAGGLGMAPLRALIHEALRRRGDFDELWILAGARSPGDLVYHGEFSAWEAGGAGVVATVDRGDASWTGPVGLVTELLIGELAERIDWPSTTAFICGPEVMMRSVSDRVVELGASPERIWLTLERNMQCGNALCGHCQLGPLLVCRDGPVVAFDEIGPFLTVKEL